MDDLDRLHRRLVHNIRATRPEYLKIPFSIRELYEQIVPYRHNRRELAIETNDDYETALARLLSGERGYVVADPTLQESLRRELASPTGDPGVFKDHGDATITLTAAAESALTPAGLPLTMGTNPSSAARDAGPSDAVLDSVRERDPVPRHAEMTPGQSAVAAFDAMSPAAIAPAAPTTPVPTLLESLTSIDVPTGCRFCGGTLPEGRDSNYCPHCGENLRTRRCPACGAEMDSAWRFCVTCGRAAG
ncbi:MAG: zinc ribbon domain-containing protein [Gemmatimonadaceae bacterium]